MNYIFRIPPQIQIDRKIVKTLHGGFCGKEGEIYLYGFGDSECEWDKIIEHENVHSLLHGHKISRDKHHLITDRMENLGVH